MEEKLKKLYYSPGGYWKGTTAIKKLSQLSGYSEAQTFKKAAYLASLSSKTKKDY